MTSPTAIQFEWDPRKEKINLKKHKISFSEAITVFADPLARILSDETHSAEEIRELIIGTSERRRLLFVCFTERAPNIVRIFSARKTTRKERQKYEETIR